MMRTLRIISWTPVVCLFCLAAVTRGRAQFETRATISTSPYAMISAAIGDFNGDGKLDVAGIADGRLAGNVTIFLGNGDGTFMAGSSYAVAVHPFRVAAASLRNNRILDLIVGDSGSNNVFVMLGNGDGTFQPAVAYLTTAEPSVVSVGDFTGHGHIDIIALTGPAQCNCVEVLPGSGDGTFRAAVVTPVPYNVDGFAMAAADFNEDGVLDVAVSGGFGSTNQVNILLGNGDGSFTADGFYPVGADPYSVVTGRFTVGKKIDLAVGLNNSVGVLLGNGDGTFQQAVDYGTLAFTNWVAVGDLNGDGKEDLVSANVDYPANQFVGSASVLLGGGDGTFQSAVVYPAGEELDYIGIGDLNGDHKPDLVAVDFLGNAVITLLNTGVLAFSPTTPLTFPTQLIGTAGSPLVTTLTNQGTSPLILSSVSYSGQPFKVQTTCRGSLNPGGSCSITATFAAEVEGIATGAVTIRDSSSSKPQVVELVGTGTVVRLSPAQLNFPPQNVGTTSKPQHIRLTNTGGTALDFTSKIYINGISNAFFETNNCPTALNAGASCTLSVVFAPRMKGLVGGSVIITDTGGGSPQSVPLTGNGD